MALIDRERLACVGRVVRAHGMGGEVRVASLGSSPELLATLHEVVAATPAGLRVLAVRAARPAGGQWLLAFAGVDDRTAAEALAGAELLVDESLLPPLAADEFFVHDLVGCAVEDLGGRRLGWVRDVMETGANDVLVVQRENGTAMVPMVGDVVKGVDLQRRAIRIDPLPGLFDPTG